MANTFHRARKRFGQNFLVDRNVIDKIIRAVNPKSADHIVEIGPGQGALTLPLLEKVESLDVVELDFDLIPRLKQLAEGAQNRDSLAIHQGDALKFDFAQLVKDSQRLRIVGNLPYNISTPLLFHLLNSAAVIEDIHVMLQKEVVDRLAAEPGTSDYGRLSVMVQYRCEVNPLFQVAPGSFSPAPKVDSVVVKLVPYAKPPYPCRDEKWLSNLVRQAFAQRRKTLRNNLKGMLSGEQITAAGINPGLRAETLTVAQFVHLSDVLYEAEKQMPSL
jgi:16S rRNA (adenine1518-N6/adenine1519-N6)-dimethyltransferase